MQSLYDRDAVKFMWQELEGVGVTPLTTSQDVEQFFADQTGTALLVFNSVCGCAAGNARPGVAMALQSDRIPDRRVTVFAGVDREAVEAARARMAGVPPSSPSVALFKDGKLVFMLERRHIEGSMATEVAARLIDAFNEHCSAAGPSVPKEQFSAIYGAEYEPPCGSSFKITRS